jgi:hypothetical protein
VALFNVVSRYLPVGSEENHENLNHDCRCSGRNTNRTSPGGTSEASPPELTCSDGFGLLRDVSQSCGLQVPCHGYRC